MAPGKGEDLALVDGVTSEVIGRNASKKLWDREELKNHMLSPKGKCKAGAEPRTDFSPTRKELFKGFICSMHAHWHHIRGAYLIRFSVDSVFY